MKKQEHTSIVTNKKAYFDYEIIDSWEAGIELRGYETKSIRNKHVNLKGSYIVITNNELYIKSMHITALGSLPNSANIDIYRTRKVFLHRKTIIYLTDKSKQPGYSIIPLELYFSGNLIKLRVGLAKGRKKHDKKQVLKERDMKKQADNLLKQYI